MPIQKTTNITDADVWKDITVLEKIEFESAFRGSGEGGKWPWSGAQAKTWQDGHWQTILEMPPIENLFTANPLIGDFDVDGVLEVAFMPWKDQALLDVETGKIKSQCLFTAGRSYGLPGVYDIDHDGTQKFLVMADFIKHVNVVHCVTGK